MQVNRERFYDPKTGLDYIMTRMAKYGGGGPFISSGVLVEPEVGPWVSCVVTNRTSRGRITLRIGSRVVDLDLQTSRGFSRMMDLRGWSAQQAFDHLMATKWREPWRVALRLGRRKKRK